MSAGAVLLPLPPIQRPRLLWPLQIDLQSPVLISGSHMGSHALSSNGEPLCSFDKTT